MCGNRNKMYVIAVSHNVKCQFESIPYLHLFWATEHADWMGEERNQQAMEDPKERVQEHVDLKLRPVKLTGDESGHEAPQINNFREMSNSNKRKKKRLYKFLEDGWEEKGTGNKKKVFKRDSLDTCFYLRKGRQFFLPETYITQFVYGDFQNYLYNFFFYIKCI